MEVTEEMIAYFPLELQRCVRHQLFLEKAREDLYDLLLDWVNHPDWIIVESEELPNGNLLLTGFYRDSAYEAEWDGEKYTREWADAEKQRRKL